MADVEVRASRIEGLGLFAARPVQGRGAHPAGERGA